MKPWNLASALRLPVLLVAAACSPLDALVTDLPADLDGDGYVAATDGGPDCDDTNPAIHPGAEERCDRADNDCDGATDEDDAADAATWYLDADGDGFGDPNLPAVACEAPDGYVADPSDCDDARPEASPGQQERCGDGIDNDCDGATDEDDAADAATWYLDADGDGFGDPDVSAVACEAPDGYVADPSDCDDARPEASPGQQERCGDGIDNDCDGATDEDDAADAATWYLDADGDGFGDPDVPAVACEAPDGYVADPSDCDDREPAAFPGAEEVCGNTIDEDCDGLAPPCGPSGNAELASVAETELVGEAIGDSAGNSLAGPGDVDGDGNPDIVVGAPYRHSADTKSGSAYIVLGPPASGPSDLAVAATEWTGKASYDYAGIRVAAAGDVDADGYQDVLVGANGDDSGGPYAGAAFLLLGPPRPGTLGLDDADLQLHGEDSSDYAGSGLAGAGDVDGDGYDDFLVAAPYRDDPYDQGGTVYLVLGPAARGATSLASADLRILPEASRDFIGSWEGVAGAGDLDGDGLHDVLVGAYGCDAGGVDSGCAYVVLGPLAAGTMDLALADGRLHGQSAGDFAGWALAGAGDVDGDGYDDFLVGAYGRDDARPDSGAAYVVLGPPPAGANSLSVAHTVLLGEAENARAGYSVATAGDVDGDGLADILIGANGDTGAGAESGAAYLLLGPPAMGSFDLGGADAKLTGSTSYDQAGVAVAPAGDVNGDGFDDFLVGAIGTGGHGDDTGSAYLVLGGL